MTQKISRILASLVVAAVVSAAPTIKNAANNIVTKPQTTSQQTEIEFNERKYPNFYRIAGKAHVKERLEPSVVKYNEFDRKGRTLGVYANLTNVNLRYGQRRRGYINNIKPSGWTQNREVTLRFINGTTYHGWFYNRSHLLAHSLGGDDADYNMITGTRPQNVGKNNGKGGMQYTEMKAYNYLKTHRNGQVYYSAEPNYNGNESVPRTVTVNIRSDDGSIDQCVIVYNVAPGYAIDYVTGNFTVSLKNKKEVS
jgi:DNA-entry nuclease